MNISNAIALPSLRPWSPVRREVIQKCLTSPMPLHIDGQVGYVQLPIGPKDSPTHAWFLLDTGTTQSYVDAKLMPESAPPAGASQFASKRYHPEVFHFFGDWPKTGFRLSDYSQIRSSVKQAGIIGTDFLAQHPYIFDYAERVLYRSNGFLNCSFGELNDAGLVALSTQGYYSKVGPTVTNSHNVLVPNVPTVPIRIGSEKFVAQIDSGYNDSRHPYSININVALKNALDAAGVPLIPVPRLNSTLSTCVPGVRDEVTAYRLGENSFFSFVDVGGNAINQYGHVNLFLKTTPPEAKICGGISTWEKPAAQLGASFFRNAGFVIFDPLTSLVWIPKTE